MSQDARCNMDSIPLCLRHSSKWDALEHAGYLAEFLQVATESLLGGELCASKNEVRGMSICFDLLRDKLRIANDELDWPTCDHYGKNTLRVVGPESVDDKGDNHA